MKTTILLEITHKKPIQDLTDFVADRAYRLEDVDDVTAKIAEEQDYEVVIFHGTKLDKIRLSIAAWLVRMAAFVLGFGAKDEQLPRCARN